MAEESKGEFLNESAAARRAFDDYRSLGMNRSVRALLDLYESLPDEEVPARSFGTLQRWYQQFAWAARCAEAEAHVAEMSEALVVKDRAYRKRQRLKDYDQMTSLCRTLLTQLQGMIEPYYAEDDPETLIYPLPVEKLIALLPRLGTLMIQSNQAMRAELGEDVQRTHITIERVIDSFPAEYRQPLREALFEQLELGAGSVDG